MNTTHDYTKSTWGKSVTNWVTADGGLTASCCGWGHGIKKDDYLLLSNGAITSRYLVESISYFSDPSDMWKAALKFAPRTVLAVVAHDTVADANKEMGR